MSDYKNKLQQLLLQIPKGKVTTYKEIAHAMGIKGYRFVGQLLNKNPYPDKYPCYKVVNSDGRIGGYGLGVKEKIRRLETDGVIIENGKVINFKSVLFKFTEELMG
ncbi:MGMT family protein [Patescibacteria group bacterium]|nr:MGMT family protein [Patescibacteria group bacterium]MBU1683601.1 MGMT family protein [Patescibacteria group bacterium]MBU1934434.1 MGMT family protein [Patescibacteria group bacterium]